MTDLRQPAYDQLAPDARALVDRWARELEGENADVVRMWRFLAAMAAVKLGALREVRRGELDGRAIVVLHDPETESLYQVEDPRLGEAEAELVSEMVRVVGARRSP